MSNPSRLLALAGLLLSLGAAPLARAAHTDSPDAAYADPSGRVARLNHMQGEVSYSPAGEDDWIDAARNRPLIRGDRVWTDRAARAELQVGNAALRLGADTSFEILNLNDRIAQVRLSQGTLNLRVRRLFPGQSYEVDTPTLAFVVTRAGRYRIDVDARDDQTTVVVWEGAGEVYGDRSHFPIRAGESVRFYGDDLRDHEVYGLPRADAFDRYCRDRDRRLDRSASLRYLDDDVVGYADLDEYGSWRPVRGYGTVWFPTRVDAGWAPYRDGHWVWQEPWGWTWVDAAPWGFAPSHYGRWVHVSSGWGWMPGPRNVRPVYAPALVAFVGGRGWSLSLSVGQSSPIGWFPLAPREVYVPSYPASREYFTRVNVNNTVINNTVITNVYNNNYGDHSTSITQVTYANRTVAGAVTAVPGTVFASAQPVRPAALRVEGAAVTSGEVTRVAPLAPSARSVMGPGAAARVRPSREAQERPVVARSAPPRAERPFAARERQLQRSPGQVPEPVAAAPAAEGPKVRVIAEQPGAVDARAAGSRRQGKGAARANATAPLPPLDRGAGEPGPGAAPPAPIAGEPQAVEQQRGAAREQEQRQRKAEKEQRDAQAVEEQRAAGREQEQRQRKAESDQREVQAEQQRGAAREQEQRQRKEKEQRDAQAVEQQRAAGREQEQRQRKAEGDQQAIKEEQAARQRQAERERQVADQQKAEQQRLADEQQQQRQGKAEGEQRRIAEEQRLERERLAGQQRQEQRQLKSEGDAQAAERERAERERQAEAQRLEQAECERQAVARNQDKRQCQPAKPPRAKRGKDGG